jgi:hypothetical protein
MIALVDHASDSCSVELGEMPVPEIGNESVLLKVKAAANCGGDRHQFAVKQSWKTPSLGKKMGFPVPAIEALHPEARGVPKVVLFDFDGTLSLLRAGWAGVMVPMMVTELAELKSGESEAELY